MYQCINKRCDWPQVHSHIPNAQMFNIVQWAEGECTMHQGFLFLLGVVTSVKRCLSCRWDQQRAIGALLFVLRVTFGGNPKWHVRIARNGDTPKWIVFKGKSMKLDDLRVHPFMETPTCHDPSDINPDRVWRPNHDQWDSMGFNGSNFKAQTDEPVEITEICHVKFAMSGSLSSLLLILPSFIPLQHAGSIVATTLGLSVSVHQKTQLYLVAPVWKSAISAKLFPSNIGMPPNLWSFSSAFLGGVNYITIFSRETPPPPHVV